MKHQSPSTTSCQFPTGVNPGDPTATPVEEKTVTPEPTREGLLKEKHENRFAGNSVLKKLSEFELVGKAQAAPVSDEDDTKLPEAESSENQDEPSPGVDKHISADDDSAAQPKDQASGKASTVSDEEQTAESKIESIAALDALDQGSGGDIPGHGYQPSSISAEAGLWTGAAVASIPIDVLPGPNGHAPDLTLGYSSNVIEDIYFKEDDPTRRESWLVTQASPYGYGWNLSGIPEIRRVPDAPVWDTDPNDEFGYQLSLGGKSIRLIEPKLDTNYSGAGTRVLYQTYPQSFIYVARTRVGPQAKCNYREQFDEDRWEIIASDGTHYEFGGKDNTKLNAGSCTVANPDDLNAVQMMPFHSNHTVLPGVWKVTRITDTTGNVMRYRYIKEEEVNPYRVSVDYDAAVTLSEITYGGSNESTHRSKIEVIQQTQVRDDCVIHIPPNGPWNCGVSPNGFIGYRSEYLIDRIQVRFKNRNDVWETVRAYNLGYTIHERTQGGNYYERALLTSVTVADEDLSIAAKELPPYTMAYNTAPTRINWLPLSSFKNGYGADVQFTYKTTEVNVSCMNEQGNDLKNHPRYPVDTKSQFNNGLPVSSSQYEYVDSVAHATKGRCTEKYAHDIPGPYSDWFEFLGYGKVEETRTDQKQTTSTGDDESTHITTEFLRCQEEADNCWINGGLYHLEPHPNKGSIEHQQVRSGLGQQVLSEDEFVYSVETLSVPYTGLGYGPSNVDTLWGHLDTHYQRQWGAEDAISATTFLSATKVVSYTYDIAQQGNAQWGMATDITEFAQQSDFPTMPYRTLRKWYATKDSINKTNFDVTASTFMVDRVIAEALYKGGSTASGDILEVTWNYYDGAGNHTDGVDRKGQLTKSSELESITSFPAHAGSNVVVACSFGPVETLSQRQPGHVVHDRGESPELNRSS